MWVVSNIVSDGGEYFLRTSINIYYAIDEILY